MQGLLIANEDRQSRDQLADLFVGDGYQVTKADSVVNALEGILNKTIQVVVLGGNFDEQHVAKLVPLLKKCNQYLSIILISDEMPLNLLRRIRKEGIFYHALKPAGEEGREEISQAVHCAFRTYQARRNTPNATQLKEVSMRRVKTFLASLSLVMMAVAPALAADTATTYTSGILILGFIGVCALLVVAQLLPALRSLFGITKDAAKKRTTSNYSHVVSKKN
jgi:DNA-binding NtrC family response regulator